jgi:hypothetical protein
MGSALTNKMLEIAAGDGRAGRVNVTGAIFVCKESSAKFDMQFDDGEKFPCESGFSLKPPSGFTRITFYNKSATEALTVDFYAGDTSVQYDYLGRAPKTRAKATSLNLASLATADFLGVDSGQRRKAIMLTNAHASDSFQLIDIDSATVCMTLYAQRTYQIETDANLRIKINGANTINVQALELFYT